MVRKSKRYSILLGVNIIYIAKFLKAFATKVKKNFYFGKNLISKFFMKIFILKRNILYFKKKNIFLNFVFKTNFLDIKFYNAQKTLINIVVIFAQELYHASARAFPLLKSAFIINSHCCCFALFI